MSNRNSSENSDSISLFPFLAVLLCTMGALLVLLVIVVQRAAETSLLPEAAGHQLASANGPVLSVPKIEKASEPVIDAEKAAEIQRQLSEIAEYQKKLDEIKAEGQERIKAEQERLSHLEDHRRRLEEELAKLAIAAEQLKQTEANQSVDQVQAEEELARLAELIKEKEKQLADLKESPKASKISYAIIPFKGRNGTFRMPVYLECKNGKVTIQPEGHQLDKYDFIALSWPGNPLAAALRATREYHNEKARQAGQPEPPDPYPLMIVRPSGQYAFMVAKEAITAWDSDYGIEFVEEDMKLVFPQAADPQLAQVQNHALMIARERLQQMVQAAPSRFPGVKVKGGTGLGGEDGSESEGAGTENQLAITGGTFRNGAGTGGNSARNGEHEAENTDETQVMARYGQYYGEPNSPAANVEATGGAIGAKGGGGGGSVDGEMTQDAQAQDGPDLGPRYAQQGGGGAANKTPSEPINGQDPTGNGQMAGVGTVGGGITGSGFSSTGKPDESIANTRGINWAVNKPRHKSVAIRRTIHAVVRDNQMTLLAPSDTRRGSQAKQISLDQPIETISDEFSGAVKERIDDWGLAGSGMYWKPVLELNVEPGAHMTATRISRLLDNSGVEVQVLSTANNQGTDSGSTFR